MSGIYDAASIDEGADVKGCFQSCEGSVEIPVSWQLFSHWLNSASGNGCSFPCGMFLLRIDRDIPSAWHACNAWMVEHSGFVGCEMGSQVLAEVVMQCLKAMSDEDVQKKWYALIRDFFPLVPGPASSSDMQQYRRIKGQIHRELDAVCALKDAWDVCAVRGTMPSVEGNVVGKDKCALSCSLIMPGSCLEKIFSGEKSWDLRSKSTKKRGRIGLISSGSGKISGEAWVIDCLCLREVDSSGVSRLRHGSFEEFFEKHRCTEDEINLYFNGNVYAWVLGKVSKYENTVAYTPRQGAVMWVRTR